MENQIKYVTIFKKCERKKRRKMSILINLIKENKIINVIVSLHFNISIFFFQEKSFRTNSSQANCITPYIVLIWLFSVLPPCQRGYGFKLVALVWQITKCYITIKTNCVRLVSDRMPPSILY